MPEKISEYKAGGNRSNSRERTSITFRKNKRKPRKNNRTIKKYKIGGGLFGQSSSKTTQEQLDEIKRKVGDTKLKEIENIIINNINDLKSLKEKCKDSCTKCCDNKKDPQTCDQLNEMIEQKPVNEWTNFCNNTNFCNDTNNPCKKYLNTYTSVEVFINKINEISKNSNKLFDEYKKNEVKRLSDTHLFSFVPHTLNL